MPALVQPIVTLDGLNLDENSLRNLAFLYLQEDEDLSVDSIHAHERRAYEEEFEFFRKKYELAIAALKEQIKIEALEMLAEQGITAEEIKIDDERFNNFVWAHLGYIMGLGKKELIEEYVLEHA